MKEGEVECRFSDLADSWDSKDLQMPAEWQEHLASVWVLHHW